MDEIDEIKQKKMEELLEKKSGEADYPSDPLEITDANFGEILGKYPLVLVDFWASWCHPCKAIAPAIQEIAKEYRGKLVCAKLNVDENPKSTMEFQTFSIPTIFLFKNGKIVETIVGAVPKSFIESKIAQHLV